MFIKDLLNDTEELQESSDLFYIPEDGDYVNENDNLTDEEIQEGLNFIFNIVPVLSEEVSLFNEEYILTNEGANTELTKATLNLKKDFKKYTKMARKNIKEGNTSEAKQNLQDAKKCIDDLEKELKNFDVTDTFTNLKGSILGTVLYFANNIKMFLPLFGLAFAGNFTGKYFIKKLDATGDNKYFEKSVVSWIIEGIGLLGASIKSLIDADKYEDDRINFDRKYNKDTVQSTKENLVYSQCIQILNKMKKILDKISSGLK